MQRVALGILLIGLLNSAATAQEMTQTPQHVQKHMKGMVGEWTFKGTEGDRTFSGAETIRLVNNQTALLQQGYFALTDGTKEHYTILSGWDGTKNTILVRGFTSDGVTWAGEWKKLKDGKWEGTASGRPATFEVKQNTMRYEEAGDGTPWIMQFQRSKTEPKGK